MISNSLKQGGITGFTISDPIENSCILTMDSVMNRTRILELISEIGFEVVNVIEE